MSKFDELDGLIVSRIRRAPCTFTELQGPVITGAAVPLATTDRLGSQRPAWRVIDRRLQALRKAGHIVYLKGRWDLTRAKP